MFASNSGESEEAAFRAWLLEFVDGHKPVDELLEFPLFKRRLWFSCLKRTGGNQTDSDDLYSEVSIKLWKVLPKAFKPDWTKRYGNFFAWLETVTKRQFIDGLRRITVEFSFEELENLGTEDPAIGIEERFLWNENGKTLMRAIHELPPKKRLAVGLCLFEGYSYREAAERVTAEGKKCSHASVRNWTQKLVSSLFPEAKDLQQAKPSRKPNAPSRSTSGSSKNPKERVSARKNEALGAKKAARG